MMSSSSTIPHDLPFLSADSSKVAPLPFSRHFFSAIRAKQELRFHPAAAPRTILNPPIREGVCRHLPGFIRNHATPVAVQEAFSLFYSEEGNEEEAQVMVQTLKPSGGIPAAGAEPWLVIELYFPGLYSADKDKSASPPWAHFSLCVPCPPAPAPIQGAGRPADVAMNDFSRSC
jgi:hypothetical protein